MFKGAFLPKLTARESDIVWREGSGKLAVVCSESVLAEDMRQLTAGQAGRHPTQDRPFICGDQVLRT